MIEAENRDLNSLFPGEYFFHYWKTSASLWESQLARFKDTSTIWVPLNWGFHSDTGDRCDFSHTKPETDLKRLVAAARKNGKDVLLFLPLGPMPYLPNGGIPSLLARSPAQAKNGIDWSVVDADGRVNKFYSFFDPRIFQGYQKFVWELANYMRETGLDVPVIGLNPGYFFQGFFHSYMIDYSATYQQGFAKFLKIKFQDKGEELPAEGLGLIEELAHQKAYTHMICDLYLTSAQEQLAGHWLGKIDMAYLGGAPKEIFARSWDDPDYQINLFKDLMGGLSFKVVPSSTLLPKTTQYQLSHDFILDYLKKTSFIETFLNSEDDSTFDDHHSGFLFHQLDFFEFVFRNIENQVGLEHWSQTGLLDHLVTHYRNTYQIKRAYPSKHAAESEARPVMFLLGQDQHEEDFKDIVRIFLNGGKIILDKAKMTDDIARKYQVFFTENDLKLEKANFHTLVESTQMGEGRLIIFNSDDLAKQTNQDRHQFWQALLSTLDLVHLKIEDEVGVDYYWRTRLPSNNELDFEEIRRLSLYNATTLKRNIRIPSQKGFAFIRYVDHSLANVKSTNQHVEVEIAPNGRVSLEYGYFES